MANLMRNAMAYFGFAEEDEQYDDAVQQRETEPQRQHVSAPQTVRVDEHSESSRPAPVTPIARGPKAVPTPSAGDMNEILTVHPKAYNQDAQLIAENFRNGIPVIMNLSQAEDADARRLIDFASGLTQGLYGKIERVTSRVFLLSPEHVNVHGDTRSEDSATDGSFFA